MWQPALAATRLAAGAALRHLRGMTQIAHLPGRAVLSVTGTDRVAFLNGLVSNDVAEAASGRAVWAALLTAQGKWLADFFILADGGRAAAGLRGGAGGDAGPAPVALPPARRRWPWSDC